MAIGILALLLLAPIALVAHRAEAMPPASSSGADAVHLEYHAPPSCPEAARYLAQVESRTGALRGSPRRISVDIRQAGGRMEGVVRVDDAPERRLHAASCFAVVEGLALVTAVMLEASTASEEPARPDRLPDESDAPDVSDRRARSPRWLAAASFAAIGNAAPALLLGGAVTAEVGIGTSSPWRPAVRLTLAGATSRAAELGSGAATFTLLFARVQGCPIAVRAGIGWLVPCVHVEAGQMTADGLARGAVVEPYTNRAGWLGLGLGAELRVPLSPRLVLEAAIDVTAPLRRRNYVFENPREVAYTTPILAVGSRVGIGLTFP